jgi:L-lysine 6-transaminase
MPEVTVPADAVFPILKDNILVDGFHVVIDLEKSRGSVIVDALEGKEYLDCYGYFATLPIGHNHPKMDDEGFRKSLMIAALCNPANSDMYSKEFAAFVKKFRDLAVPDDFVHLFFIAGGALAVENAMKAAFDWKAQKNRAKGIDGGADKIMHFREAFHGRSGYTLSVTNTDPTKTDDFPKFDWPRISSPALEFPVNEAEIAAAEEQACKEIEAAFANDPHGIAGILIEPIQCEGGDRHFRPEFMRKLRDYADEHEALLLFDEVQTGMGVTGKMWAYQLHGVTPDIISFGKKTQVCGIMSTSRIDDVPTNVFQVSSRINSTWGGNLVDMVRCARYLEIIEEESLIESAAKVGSYFLEGLLKLAADFDVVSNVRGQGLLLAFDTPDGETRDRIRQKCWDAGFAALACGPRSLRFRPPLVFSREEADQALTTLREVLGKM